MIEIPIGKVLQEERKKQNLSQEELCDGICAVSTLSRVENEKGNTSMRIINALLQRLGLDGGRFYARLTTQEQEVENLSKEIISCNVRFQSANEAERPAVLAESYEKIHALENIMESDDSITAQFLLRSRVILGREDGTPYTAEDAIAMLNEAIRLTVPKFELEHLERWRYTMAEMKILNQIAGVYGKNGQQEKAIEIYQKLMDYIQRSCRNIKETAGMLTLVTHNYALDLRMLERYQEAIEIGELGRRTSEECGHYQYLGGILHTLGECYHFLGNNEMSINYFFEAYFQYKSAGNERGVTLLQADARMYFPELKQITSMFGRLFGTLG